MDLNARVDVNFARVDVIFQTVTVTLLRHGWLVGWFFGLSGLLRQYFSLYRAVSQREGEREEKG